MDSIEIDGDYYQEHIDRSVCICGWDVEFPPKLGADGKLLPEIEQLVPPVWATNPHCFGCPKHGPIKQYCRVHHNGFYGSCHLCQNHDLIQKMRYIADYLASGLKHD